MWDDSRNEIYVDSEGIQEEFTSEWQAEDYLEQVRKAAADKETAEWLAVERDKQEISPHGPDEQEGKAGVENIASYQSGDERIVISRYPNGKYYNRYGYDEQRDFAATTAGGFDTFEEAEKTLYSHRPKIEDGIMRVHVRSTRKNVECPYCGSVSKQVHSIYPRKFRDLPIQGMKVEIIISNRKFFCPNEECTHKTFAESYECLPRMARRSRQLTQAIVHTAIIQVLSQHQKCWGKELRTWVKAQYAGF